MLPQATRPRPRYLNGRHRKAEPCQSSPQLPRSQRPVPSHLAPRPWGHRLAPSSARANLMTCALRDLQLPQFTAWAPRPRARGARRNRIGNPGNPSRSVSRRRRRQAVLATACRGLSRRMARSLHGRATFGRGSPRCQETASRGHAARPPGALIPRGACAPRGKHIIF